MKKTVCLIIFCTLTLLCTLCICTACHTIVDPGPPLSGSATAVPHPSTLPETPEIAAPAEKIRLEMSPLMSESGQQDIKYTYINDTNAAVNILAIPCLEVKTPDGWKNVEFSENIGFCGTPDCLAANSRSLDWTLDVEYLYGGPLDAGTYRLSFDILDNNYNPTDVISAEFALFVCG